MKQCESDEQNANEIKLYPGVYLQLYEEIEHIEKSTPTLE